jgi:hypothetical protein
MSLGFVVFLGSPRTVRFGAADLLVLACGTQAENDEDGPARTPVTLTRVAAAEPQPPRLPELVFLGSPPAFRFGAAVPLVLACGTPK